MSAYPPWQTTAADCPVTREGVETMQKTMGRRPEEMAIVERILQENARRIEPLRDRRGV